ncbi:MAG: hypothetical protein QGG40_17625 [Myxococcota bacterium]|nr:hypothetical protein [Myxococcota bacterium]
MLRIIDSHWVQHLTNMENLRQGIGLQAHPDHVADVEGDVVRHRGPDLFLQVGLRLIEFLYGTLGEIVDPVAHIGLFEVVVQPLPEVDEPGLQVSVILVQQVLEQKNRELLEFLRGVGQTLASTHGDTNDQRQGEAVRRPEDHPSMVVPRGIDCWLGAPTRSRTEPLHSPDVPMVGGYPTAYVRCALQPARRPLASRRHTHRIPCRRGRAARW